MQPKATLCNHKNKMTGLLFCKLDILRTARVERMISDIFYRNPQYQLINIETLNDWKKIRYWYSIPRGESFRD